MLMTAAFSLPPHFQEFLEHWRSFRPSAHGAPQPGLPRLSDFLDKPSPRFAPWLTISDVDDPILHRVRLIGTGVVDFFNYDSTGSNFLVGVTNGLLETFRRCHYEVPRRPCGKFQKSICSTSAGRERAILGMALPLIRADGGLSVMWFLNVGESPDPGEIGAQITRLTGEYWIDLGNGVPD